MRRTAARFVFWGSIDEAGDHHFWNTACDASERHRERVRAIATRGASKGKAYYLEPTKDGWVDDGIGGGTLSFVRYPNGNYDLLFKDRIGTRLATQDGAAVAKVFSDENQTATFVVVYPSTNVVETYQLSLDDRGQGILIWSNIEYRSGLAAITRGMLMVSNCSR